MFFIFSVLSLGYNYIENPKINRDKSSWAVIRVLAEHEDYSDYENYLRNDFKELKNLIM